MQEIHETFTQNAILSIAIRLKQVCRISQKSKEHLHLAWCRHCGSGLVPPLVLPRDRFVRSPGGGDCHPHPQIETCDALAERSKELCVYIFFIKHYILYINYIHCNINNIYIYDFNIIELICVYYIYISSNMYTRSVSFQSKSLYV